jgi:hypothetical protein
MTGKTVRKDPYPASQFSFPKLLVVPMELRSRGSGEYFSLEILLRHRPSVDCGNL